MGLARLIMAMGAMPAVSRPVRASLKERLGITSVAVENPLFLFGKKAIEPSNDLARILALPRRPRPNEHISEALVDAVTQELRLPEAPCKCAPRACIKRLLPVQAWYLDEARSGGVLGHIIVGGGKTGIDILLPMVVPNVRRAVLLIPSGLRAQFFLDYAHWARHWRVPNLAGGRGVFYADRPVLEVLSYNDLSRAKHATWLASVAPDLIIADEAHNLADRRSVRTGRFLRYFGTHETTCFCAHSGSLTTDSLDDYAHLSALARRAASPLPLDPGVVREWCAAIDPAPEGAPAPIGALRALCAPGEHVRSGFRRRLVETPGVVTTEDAALPVKIHLHRRDPGPIPASVFSAIDTTRKIQARPDGEELVEALEVATCLRQIAAGFFYRWKYPRGEPAELIEKWFGKRQAWNRELRDKLMFRVDHLDSPLLCREAAERAWAGYAGELPVWKARTWPEWRELSPQVVPSQDTVWLSDFLVKDAIAWAQEAPGIVWYLHSSFGHAVANMGHLPLYGAGTKASEEILTEDGSRSIVCSIKAHGMGKNLQAFNRMLVANPPSSGGIWEQMIGRLHRQGQTKDVHVYLYLHTLELQEALDSAIEHAKYVQATTGKAEKLLFAERSAVND